MDVNEFGWKVVEGHLQIDWDDPSNTKQVRACVFYYGGVGAGKDVVIEDVHV